MSQSHEWCEQQVAPQKKEAEYGGSATEGEQISALLIAGSTVAQFLKHHGYELMSTITNNRFWTGAVLVLVVSVSVSFTIRHFASRSAPRGKVTAAQPGEAQGSATGATMASAENHEHDGPAQPGRYLQVAAMDRPGATALAEAYRRHGFQVVIRPSPQPSVFRVLIGPLGSDNAIASTKARLKAIGINTPLLRTF